MTSPNGETDMNDIDIEEGRRLAEAATAGPWEYDAGHWQMIGPDGEGFLVVTSQIEEQDAALAAYLRNNAAAMFDAIETGRQWKTIARRLADAVEALLEPDDGQPEGMDLHGNLVYAHPEWEAKNALAAFRALADRTPTPTDGA